MVDGEKTGKKYGMIVRNFSYLTIGKILGDIFSFILFVMLSRTYGQDGIGHYSFAIALTGFFMVLADFGLTNLSIKDMSRRQGDIELYYSHIFTMRLVLTVLSYGLLVLMSLFLPGSFDAWLIIIIIGAYQILYAVLEGLGAVFIAHERMHYTSLIEFSAKATSAILCVAAILSEMTLVSVLAILPAVVTMHIIIAYVLVSRKYGQPRIRLTIERMKGVLRDAKPYALFAFLAQLSTRIDVVVLGVMLGAAAAGVYNVAYRIVFLLLFIPYFAGMSLFPVISRFQHAGSDKELEGLYHGALRVAILLGLPVASGIWLIAPELIDMIFGEQFEEAVSILRLLAMILLFASMKGIMGTFLTACDRQIDRTRSQWIAAWANVIGNVALIPIYGIKGAAYSTVLSEALLLFLIARKLRDLFGWPRIGSRVIIGGSGVAAFLIPLGGFTSLPMPIVVLIAVLIYVTVIMLFKEVRINEGKVLVSLFKS